MKIEDLKFYQLARLIEVKEASKKDKNIFSKEDYFAQMLWLDSVNLKATHES